MLAKSLGSLFVHVPKTAGQSVEHLLCDKLGIPWKERANDPNALLQKSKEPGLPSSFAHLAAKEFVSAGLLSEQEWSDLFTFAIVRNPWERLISVYHYMNYDFLYSFDEYLFDYFPTQGFHSEGLMVRSQVNYLCDEGGEEVLVDQLIRYESLEADWLPVAARLGLSTVLPRVNSTRKWTWSPTDMVRLGRRR